MVMSLKYVSVPILLLDVALTWLKTAVSAMSIENVRSAHLHCHVYTSHESRLAVCACDVLSIARSLIKTAVEKAAWTHVKAATTDE